MRSWRSPIRNLVVCLSLALVLVLAVAPVAAGAAEHAPARAEGAISPVSAAWQWLADFWTEVIRSLGEEPPERAAAPVTGSLEEAGQSTTTTTYAEPCFNTCTERSADVDPNG